MDAGGVTVLETTKMGSQEVIQRVSHDGQQDIELHLDKDG